MKTMRDYVKLLLELIKLIEGIFKIYRKEKDIKKKKDFVEAIKELDSKTFKKILFGKK